MALRAMLGRVRSAGAIGLSTALATLSGVVAASLVRVTPTWPPAFASRAAVAAPVASGPWGTPWDALTQPASIFQDQALTALAAAIGHLAVGCLLIALLSAVLHVTSRLVLQWRALTIRCALGAQLHDLLRETSGDVIPGVAAGAAAGAAGGAAVVMLLGRHVPDLLTWPRVVEPAALAFLLATLAVMAAVSAAMLPLLAYLQRRVRAVADLTGDHATQRGALLHAQHALVVLQLAGLLVVAYGGALLVRGSALLAPHRAVSYGDSATISPLALQGPAAAIAARRAAAYRAVVAAARRGDTPLVAIATPGAWLGFGKQAPLVSICQCTRDSMYHPVNGTMVRAALVSPGALRLMGLRVSQGREFTAADTVGAPPAVVLTDVAAYELFPGAAPVGQKVYASFAGGSAYQVVGVVRASAPPGLGAGGGVLPMAYFALLQQPASPVEVTARAGARTVLAAAAWPAAALSGDLRVRAGPAVPLAARLRAAGAPLAWFAGAALALAGTALAVALYALTTIMGRTVESRQREIAIRMALGAQRRDIWRWVGARSMALAFTGSLCGMALARWVGVLLRAHVRGFDEDDLWLLLAMVASFAALAIVAALVPARRAMAVDPAAAWADSR